MTKRPKQTAHACAATRSLRSATELVGPVPGAGARAWTAPTLSSALRQAGEEIWAVGIDDTYSSMKHQDDEPLGNAFDITWLTVVCIKLKEIKAGKKPRVRVKG